MLRPIIFAFIFFLTLGAESSFAQHTHQSVQAKDSAATKEYKQSGMKMMKDAPAYTGDADIDFRLQMIPHHQAALDMAKTALKYAKDQSTKDMAQQIILSQKKEISDMQEWLKMHKK
ncbi:MAG: DUF305 domain-containing protein [Pseudomonadota bacterium]